MKYSFYNINVHDEGYTKDEDKYNLYYNTLSNQFAYIPNQDVDILTPEKIDELKQKRMIVPFDLDEPEQYKQSQNKLIHDEYPKAIRLTIAVTMACNYQCEYCFEKYKDNKEMSEDTLNDIIKYIKNEIDRNPNLKVFSIKWFGGEPLLPSGLNAIRKISEFVIPYCKERNIEYKSHIITNGYFFTKEVSEVLKGLCVTHAQIAIDGLEDNYSKSRKTPKESFKRVLKNIEDSAIRVNIRLNVTRNNLDELFELLKILVELKIYKEKNARIIFSRVREYAETLQYGFTDEEWLLNRERMDEVKEYFGEELLYTLSRPKYLSCPVLQNRNVVLCSDGYLYRCDLTIGEKDYAIGTIKHGIENNKINADYQYSCLTDECMNCKFLPICSGEECRYVYLKKVKSCDLVKGKFKQSMEKYLKYVYKDN